MRVRWPNVLTIFRREVRDQLRDRRTLFMIFVLPILLYPILGMGGLKLLEAFEQKTRTVVLVGSESLPDFPPLLNSAKNGFAPELFNVANDADRIMVNVRPAKGQWLDPKFREKVTRDGGVDAVVLFPENFREQIERKESPQLAIDFDSADEQSKNTFSKLNEVLAHWQKSIIDGRLKSDNLPASYTEPLKIKPVDVATEEEVGSSVWAKIFPFLLVMMSLTGAFYPAVDLCAGEKERGTMETLLISPASRAEIVLGKFFTVLLASMATALLNLVSMGLTGMQMARQFGAGPVGNAAAGSSRKVAMMSPPSFTTAFWIILLLIPLAAFFSAICLALAVLARSMKEGQYYMTPLYLVCVPLIFLTLVPGTELNLFYSLVPITGVSLLLRALIQGDYAVAWKFFLPVLIPTIGYGLLALRWAIDQFQREDVLFREAERFDLRVWAKHLLRDKEDTPNGAEALFCFVLMLAVAWFMTQYLMFSGLGSSTAGLAAAQVGYVLTPPLAMAFFLTSSARKTLKLSWPDSKYLALAVGLGFSINPLVNELRPIVERLFPMSSDLKKALEHMMESVPDVPTMILLFAVIPAVCEELAFRGYILSGLERGHSARTAIVLSAILFGFMHVFVSLFQQLFNATILGLILGLLAVRSRSILPGIVFHLINNSLGLLIGVWLASPSARTIAPWLYRDTTQGLYHIWLVVLGLVVTVLLLSRLIPTGKAKLRETVPAEADWAVP